MRFLLNFIILIGLLSFESSRASEKEPIEIRIRNHKFYPDKVTVKAGERFKLKIINEDPTSEEFESNTMVVEKFIGPKRKMTITLGPLKPGKYEFFGELNLATAQGILTAE